jgi:hypothetical protein
MARDAVAVTALTIDAGTDLLEGVAIAPADGATLNLNGNFGKLLLWVSNTESAAYDVTIVAGTGQEAVRSSLGNLVYEVGAGEQAFIVVEGSRFAEAGGDLLVNFETGMTGFIAAYRLPDNS